MVLPIASVCSTRLPVSVLVRAPRASLEVFPGGMGSPASDQILRLASRARVVGWFPRRPPYALSRGRPEPRPATLPRHPVGGDGPRRYRNVRLLCIAYACPPRLSSRLTLGRLALPRNP